MKKELIVQRRNRNAEDMLPEYDFDYTKAKPNRFAGRIRNRVNGINKPNQRIGSISNSRVGADFELVAMKFFSRKGIKLSRDFAVDVGISKKKKHCFDLGSSDPKVIVECKSHRWTAGANVPSAKNDCMERGNVLLSSCAQGISENSVRASR